MSLVGVILAEGFEEVEAVTPIDFLRRAGIDVVTVALMELQVRGAHGITVAADTSLDRFPEEADAILIPGGMPGSANIADSGIVRDLVRRFDDQGRLVAAICAAPALVVGGAGILKGRDFTCFPGMEEQAGEGGRYTGDMVTVDGNLITACGAGAAAEFSQAVIAYLTDNENALRIMKTTCQKGY